MQTTYLPVKPLAAAFFIVLFLLTLCAAIALLFTNTPHLTLGLLGCAAISLTHARHRLGRYEQAFEQFQQRITLSMLASLGLLLVAFLLNSVL